MSGIIQISCGKMRFCKIKMYLTYPLECGYNDVHKICANHLIFNKNLGVLLFNTQEYNI